MSDIHNCIHDGKKTDIKILYENKEQTISACDECFEVIKTSCLCKILEVLE